MAEQNKDTFGSTKNHPIQEINYIRPPRWSTVKEGNAWKKIMTPPQCTSKEGLYYYDTTSSTYELWDCNGNPLKGKNVTLEEVKERQKKTHEETFTAVLTHDEVNKLFTTKETLSTPSRRKYIINNTTDERQQESCRENSKEVLTNTEINKLFTTAKNKQSTTTEVKSYAKKDLTVTIQETLLPVTNLENLQNKRTEEQVKPNPWQNKTKVNKVRANLKQSTRVNTIDITPFSVNVEERKKEEKICKNEKKPPNKFQNPDRFRWIAPKVDTKYDKPIYSKGKASLAKTTVLDVTEVNHMENIETGFNNPFFDIGADFNGKIKNGKKKEQIGQMVLNDSKELYPIQVTSKQNKTNKSVENKDVKTKSTDCKKVVEPYQEQVNLKLSKSSTAKSESNSVVKGDSGVELSGSSEHVNTDNPNKSELEYKNTRPFASSDDSYGEHETSEDEREHSDVSDLLEEDSYRRRLNSSSRSSPVNDEQLSMRYQELPRNLFEKLDVALKSSFKVEAHPKEDKKKYDYSSRDEVNSNSSCSPDSEVSDRELLSLEMASDDDNLSESQNRRRKMSDSEVESEEEMITESAKRNAKNESLTDVDTNENNPSKVYKEILNVGLKDTELASNKEMKVRNKPLDHREKNILKVQNDSLIQQSVDNLDPVQQNILKTIKEKEKASNCNIKTERKGDQQRNNYRGLYEPTATSTLRNNCQRLWAPAKKEKAPVKDLVFQANAQPFVEVNPLAGENMLGFSKGKRRRSRKKTRKHENECVKEVASFGTTKVELIDSDLKECITKVELERLDREIMLNLQNNQQQNSIVEEFPDLLQANMLKHQQNEHLEATSLKHKQNEHLEATSLKHQQNEHLEATSLKHLQNEHLEAISLKQQKHEHLEEVKYQTLKQDIDLAIRKIKNQEITNQNNAMKKQIQDIEHEISSLNETNQNNNLENKIPQEIEYSEDQLETSNGILLKPLLNEDSSCENNISELNNSRENIPYCTEVEQSSHKQTTTAANKSEKTQVSVVLKDSVCNPTVTPELTFTVIETTSSCKVSKSYQKNGMNRRREALQRIANEKTWEESSGILTSNNKTETDLTNLKKQRFSDEKEVDNISSNPIVDSHACCDEIMEYEDIFVNDKKMVHQSRDLSFQQIAETDLVLKEVTLVYRDNVSSVYEKSHNMFASHWSPIESDEQFWSNWNAMTSYNRNDFTIVNKHQLPNSLKDETVCNFKSCYFENGRSLLASTA